MMRQVNTGDSVGFDPDGEKSTVCNNDKSTTGRSQPFSTRVSEEKRASSHVFRIWTYAIGCKDIVTQGSRLLFNI